MPEVVKFKAFCLERYKSIHNLNGKTAIDVFLQYDVFSYLDSFYDVLHTFGDSYIVQDIDMYIEARKPVRQ